MKKITLLFIFISITVGCETKSTATFDILSNDIQKGKFDQVSSYLQLHVTSDFESADSLDYVLKDMFEIRINDSLKKLYYIDSNDRTAKIDSLNYYIKKSTTKEQYFKN